MAGELPQLNPQEIHPSQNILDKAVTTVDHRLGQLDGFKRSLGNRFRNSAKGTLTVALALQLLTGAGCGNVKGPDISLPWAQATETAVSTPTESTSKPPETPKVIVTPETKTNTYNFNPLTASPEKRIPTELPKDIIPTEELENSYNVHIYNTSKIEFMLRRAAIDNDPVFQWLQFKDKGTLEHQKYLKERGGESDEFEKIFNEMPRRLNVFLIEGPTVHPKFFTEEIKSQMPQSLIEAIGDDIYQKEKQIRQWFIKERDKMLEIRKEVLETLERDRASGKIDQSIYEVSVKQYEELHRPYINGPTDEDVYNNLPPTVGLFAPPSLETTKLPNGETKREYTVNILIAVGGEKPKTELKTTTSGNVTLFTQRTNPTGLVSIENKHSYPSPDAFKLTNSPTYPLEADVSKVGSLGKAARHEFFHIIAGHPTTDILTYQSIVGADEALKKGDDRLYYYVFRKKGEDGKPDVILVTQNPEAESQNSKMG